MKINLNDFNFFSYSVYEQETIFCCEHEKNIIDIFGIW